MARSDGWSARRATFEQSMIEAEVHVAACELRNDPDPTLVSLLLAALLHDPWEPRRYAASLALCFKRDERIVRPLMGVARDAAGQSIRTRCMCAEALGYLGKRKAIPCLIGASADLRFWAVFALGNFLNRRRGGRIVEQALLDRLGDHGETGAAHCGGYWTVRLEAVAMLGHATHFSGRNRVRAWREHEARLAVELERVANDPDASAVERRWLQDYA